MARERWATWWGRRLVALFPKGFRTRYGPALLDTYRERLNSVGRDSGLWVWGWHWFAESTDLIAQAVRCRFGRAPSVEMGKAGGAKEGFSLGAVVQDSRFAIRTVFKHPGFAVSAIVLLAFGIGLNTAVFSLVDGYLLRPLPIPESDRLVRVSTVPRNAPDGYRERVPERFRDVRWPVSDAIIEHVVTWDLTDFTLAGDGVPSEAVNGSWVNAGYFDALGIVPALGRGITAEDTRPGATPVALISHRVWAGRFGSDPDIVGRSLTTFNSDRPYDPSTFTIVGVLPENFWFVNRFTDVIAALQSDNPAYMIRMRSGVSIAQAEEHLTRIVRDQLPDTDPEWSLHLSSVQSEYTFGVRPVLRVAGGAAALVLLICCGNVALLLLARALRRDRELTVRRALGAGRRRITQQLVTEGMFLSVVAGALGIFLAWVGVRLLGPVVQSQIGLSVPGGVERLGLHPIVLTVALVLSVGTGLLFAWAPALVASRPEGSGSSVLGRRGGNRAMRWARRTMIGAEVALSLTLLVGAGLMIRSAHNMSRVDLGFDERSILVAGLSLDIRKYDTPELQSGFLRAAVEGIRAIPDIEFAGVASHRWPFQSGMTVPVESAEGAGGSAPPIDAELYGVDAGYIEVMNTEVLRGRAIDDRDRAGTELVVVVGERLAESLFPGEDPIGRLIRVAGDPTEPARTIVGVTENVRESFGEPDFSEVYVPYHQSPSGFIFFVAKTRVQPESVVPAIRTAIADVDPDLAVARSTTVERLVSAAGARPRFLARFLAGFGAFAIGLALFGLYSVIAYAVNQQRYAVAIRMALGAPRPMVVRMFLRQGGVAVFGGLVVGLLGTVALTRALASQLYGVGSVDPVTYVAASVLLGTAGMAAVWIPARRAARTDAALVLREE